MRSIRAYLLSRLLGGSALVLSLAGAAVYVLMTRALEQQFDRNLGDRVQALASILFQAGDAVEFEFSDQLMPEYDRDELPDYFELCFDDGRLLERSGSLDGGGLALPDELTRAPQHWTGTLPDGRTGRFVGQLVEVHHVYPEEGPGRPEAAVVRIVVARGREELLAAERALLAYCAGASLALVALIAALSWLAVGRALEPAQRLATAVDRIRIDKLPKTLDVGPLPAELAPVSEKTDALLRRVETALERERRTAADIAHELRTPISELLTVSEVALRNAGDAAGTRRALATVRDTAWRMARSVSTLLKLARLEMGAETFDHAPVDIGAVVADALRSLAPVERERELSIGNHVSAAGAVSGDPEVLRIVVSNLLGNAVYYSPRRGLVECRLERGDGTWRLLVENEAPDLSPDDLGLISAPFWRKDGARADRDRSGLGLALSCALAERTGMQLGFELAGRTFRAVLAGQSANGAPGSAGPGATPDARAGE